MLQNYLEILKKCLVSDNKVRITFGWNLSLKAPVSKGLIITTLLLLSNLQYIQIMLLIGNTASFQRVSVYIYQIGKFVIVSYLHELFCNNIERTGGL